MADVGSANLERVLAVLTVALRLRMRPGDELGDASPLSLAITTVPKLEAEDEKDDIEVSAPPRNGDDASGEAGPPYLDGVVVEAPVYCESFGGAARCNCSKGIGRGS